jgi:hypothetical protein
MRRACLLILFFFSSLFVLFQISSAVGVLRVNEAEIKMSLLTETTETTLLVENSFGQNIPATIALEIIEPSGAIAASAAIKETLKPNANVVTVPLNLNYSKLDYSKQSRILWYRLRYRIIPDATSKASGVEGIVSFSQLLTDLFELKVTTPKKVSAGSSLRVVARTTQPLSSRPIASLKVEAKIEFDDDEKYRPLTATGVSNAEGYAVLDFVLPRNLDGEDEIDLTVTTKQGEFVQEAREDIEIDRSAKIWISTDKTLYQPGQTLHLRALLFDSGARALTDKTIEIEVRDQDYSVVHRNSMKTSRFGIASADWTIPNDAKLGEYKFEVDLADEDYSTNTVYHTVKVSRYELPNFVVNIKTDKPYYTREQTTAETEVRADYLFG